MTRTDKIFPSAGCASNFCTAAAAADAVLNEMRMRCSSRELETDRWSITCPQHLKMAATSSGAIPENSPDTSKYDYLTYRAVFPVVLMQIRAATHC